MNIYLITVIVALVGLVFFLIVYNESEHESEDESGDEIKDEIKDEEVVDDDSPNINMNLGTGGSLTTGSLTTGSLSSTSGTLNVDSLTNTGDLTNNGDVTLGGDFKLSIGNKLKYTKENITDMIVGNSTGPFVGFGVNNDRDICWYWGNKILEANELQASPTRHECVNMTKGGSCDKDGWQNYTCGCSYHQDGEKYQINYRQSGNCGWPWSNSYQPEAYKYITDLM